MWSYPTVIAHRGGGSLAPENTLAGLKCALAHRFHAVEFDVMLAQDDVPVLMHDPQLGRTVTGVGAVNECTADELLLMDAGSWFGPDFAGEPVATYKQAQRFCVKHEIWMNVEIKPAPGYEEQTGRIVAELTRELFQTEIAVHVPGVYDEALPLFSSFSFDALMAAKKAAPEVPRGYLVDAIPEDWRERMEKLGAISLHTNHRNLSLEQVRAVKKAGFGLLCYTVNDPARASEILSWGVDAFCTDRIDLMNPNFSLQNENLQQR